MLGNVVDAARYLTDEKAAGEFIERLRWPDGIVRSPYTGSDRVYATKGKNPNRKQWKCAETGQKFSVTTGTVFEGSHIPLGKWVYAIFIMCSAKKSVSANQLHRELGITSKSAWFLCHRIRWAMTQEPFASKLTGDWSKVVEADETYVGPKGVKGKRGRGAGKKQIVVALVERDGKARSFKVNHIEGETLKDLVKDNVEVTAHIMTDSLKSYTGLDEDFAGHWTVDHSKEYVRGIVHTNFAESYFSLLKRAVIGTYHHISQQHMGKYLAEFDFRWNGRKDRDGVLAMAAIRAAEGKRLTYREPVNRLSGSDLAEDSTAASPDS